MTTKPPLKIKTFLNTNPDYYVWKDQYGIMGQPYSGGVEGGDAVCWNGKLNYYSKKQHIPMDIFEVKPGAYVRHPYPHPVYNRFGWYYKNPWDGNITEDQITGVIVGRIAEKDWKALWRIWFHSLAWLGWFVYNNRQNGKEPGETKWKWPGAFSPKTTQMMWRGIVAFTPGLKYFAFLYYVRFFLCDLILLFDVWYDNDNPKDDRINDVDRLHVARSLFPTIAGRWAVNNLDKEHLKSRIKIYWGGPDVPENGGWRDNPGMYKLMADAIDELG